MSVHCNMFGHIFIYLSPLARNHIIMARYTFSGHESFFCKSLWLKKGFDAVSEGVNFNSPNAVAELGVGKNMVSSIKYWMKSFGLIDEMGLTKFSNYIFKKNSGKDPYIEDIGTMWLLHYQIVKEGVASIYHLTFLDFKREKKEFDREQLLSFIKRKCNVPEQKNVYNENTVKKDIKAFLQMYVAPSDTRSIEDFSAVLIDLGLIKKLGENKYAFAEIPSSAINEHIVLYTLLDIKGESNVLSLDTMQEVALTFGLSISSLVEIIQKLVALYPDKISYTDNSGIKNIQFLEAIEPYSVLDFYYNQK